MGNMNKEPNKDHAKPGSQPDKGGRQQQQEEKQGQMGADKKPAKTPGKQHQ